MLEVFGGKPALSYSSCPAWLSEWVPLHEAGPIISPAGLGPLDVALVYDLFRSVRCGIGRHGLPRTPISTGAVDAEIVLRMLVEILCGNRVARDLSFARKANIPLEYLMCAAADLSVRAVAIKVLVWRSLLLPEWPVAVVAPTQALIRS